jgi:hypothetical protein
MTTSPFVAVADAQFRACHVLRAFFENVIRPIVAAAADGAREEDSTQWELRRGGSRVPFFGRPLCLF